jgi:predicted RNA-binding Zn-ribbon protein involved in translation (DUF1610 family)
MKNDPGLLTDSTGEGMAGAEDVRLDTQKDLSQTYYNGSKPCIECGLVLNPVQSLHSDMCPNCNRRKAAHLVKGMMA